ncbi:MAG: cytochrome c oxidase subunit 3 [Rickettsiaceae bacterium]|nr:cytochrome c oxidase subunit 3 [Rickettsiaceae bacterium]
MHKNHSFHILEPSPWPIMTSFSLFFVAIGTVLSLRSFLPGFYVLGFGTIFLLLVLYLWWSDVIREGRRDRAHTEPVRNGLRISVALFILSEIAFFGVFFASFFKFWLDPVHLLTDMWPSGAGTWPPAGIKTFDPWDVPFINTLILLLSGTTVTWAHYALEENNQKDLSKALGITVLLGIMFTAFQAYEYHHASFNLQDGIYPSNFFLITGFHGIHVIIGTIFLSVCYFRARAGHFAPGNGHLGFEFAAWYWHFVDVIWLLLFVFLYILAS